MAPSRRRHPGDRGGVAVSAVICSGKTAKLLPPVAESFLLRRLNEITAKMSAILYGNTAITTNKFTKQSEVTIDISSGS
jgi:hypothetical protein